MRRCWSLTLLGAILLITISTITGFGQDKLNSSTAPLGFAPGSRAAELEAEAHALGIPTPNNARSWLRTLTEEPHVAGTPADYKTALFVRDKLRAWGWKADLAEYEVLLNYPKGASLELIRPNPQRLPLFETAVA